MTSSPIHGKQALEDALSAPARLAALDRSRLLKDREEEATDREEAYDRITRLAGRLLGAPVSLLSLVEPHRQVFRSAFGLAEPWDERRETPLSHSFCQYVAAHEAPLVVDDASTHPLVSENLARRDLNVEAYLGVPFRAPSGEILGSLCATDDTPRAWTDGDLQTLEELSAVLTDVLAASETQYAHAQHQALVSASLDVIDDLFFVLDADLRLFEWNERVPAVTGYADSELAALTLTDLIAEEHLPAAIETAHEIVEQGHAMLEAFLVTKEGERMLYEFSGTALHDAAGELVGLCGTGRYIAERKRTEAALKIQAATLQEQAEAVWESNRRFEAVVANVPGVVYQFLSNRDGSYSLPFVRTGLWQKSGLDLSALEEHPAGLMDILHPEDAASLEASIQAHGTASEPWVWEGRVVVQDEVRWVSAISRPTPLDNGGVQWDGVLVDVTAQKTAEQALRQSEAYHRSLVEASPDLLFRLSRDGYFLDIHANEAGLLLLSPQELIGMSIEEALPQLSDIPLREAIQEALRTGELQELDYDLETRDGRLHHFEARFVQAGADEVQVIVRDVTERRASVRALHESETRFRSFVEATAQVVWHIDPSGTVKELSDAWRDFTGQVKQESGWDWLEPIHPEDRPRVIEAWQDLKEDPKPYVTEYRLRRHDGTYHRFRVRAVPIFDEGTFDGWIGTCTDVEGQRQAEEALRQSEERLRLALEAARMGTWDVDILQGTTIWSPRLLDLYGLTADDFDERESSFYDLLVDEDVDRIRTATEAALDRAAAGEDLHLHHEYRVRRPDGDVRWFRSVGRIQVDDSNRPMRMLGIAVDITDEREYQTVLIESKEAAEEARAQAEVARLRAEEARLIAEDAARTKSALLANMSHEIRTPLTGIIGFAEVIAEEAALGHSEGHVEFAQRIGRSGRRLLDTLNSVLDLAQMEAGGGRVERRDVDLSAVVVDSVELLRERAESKGLTLDIDLPPSALHIETDEAAVSRILTNLVANAIKFTKKGGVRVSVRPGDHDVALVVSDTGIGIDDTFLPLLFEAFRQESEGESRYYEGSGLGLTITKRLAEMLGGSISVESRKGQGSAFTVRLPRSG